MALKETAFKTAGVLGRVKAIGTIITGIVLIIIGIVLVIIGGSFAALIISLIGLIAVAGGWWMWKRYKAMLEGRFI